MEEAQHRLVKYNNGVTGSVQHQIKSNMSLIMVDRPQPSSELSMGWVDPWVGLGRVGSRFFSFWWVGLGWVHCSKRTKNLKGLR